MNIIIIITLAYMAGVATVFGLIAWAVSSDKRTDRVVNWLRTNSSREDDQ